MKGGRGLVLRGLAVVGLVALAGCVEEGAPPLRAERTGPRPDDRLQVFWVGESTPSPARRAYVAAVARAEARAAAAPTARAREEILREALALPVPGGLDEAPVLRLELATALCETLRERPGGAELAVDILSPMLDPGHALPLDRVTAGALVTLGDAAREVGRDALAAGSYARAIRILSMLRQEATP